MRARPRGAGWRLALVIGSLGCRAGEPDFERFQRGAAGPVVPDRNYFRDAHGRYVTFNGINVGGLLLPGRWNEQAARPGRQSPATISGFRIPDLRT
jgi:hypothetical protein